MSRPLTARGVLVWLILFFGIIIATDTFFIVKSVKTFSGEDNADPYMIGLKYNQALANRAAQAKLGWHATISTSRAASGGLEIAVSITGADGAPQADATLKGELRHPADENHDRALIFRQVRPGAYVAELPTVPKGNWEVQVENAGKIPFEASRRIWVS
jgi:nitrogen fixation protein FixH